MLSSSLLVLAFAAAGFAQAPAGYKTVYITSLVNAKFVVVPKASTAGSGIVVFVSQKLATGRRRIKYGLLTGFMNF